jgi:hypothetical protein
VEAPLTDEEFASWTQADTFPAGEPPKADDEAAVLAYQLAGSQELAVLRDTRHGRPDADYVTYHWVLSCYGEYALAGLLSQCRAALSGSGLESVPADRVQLPLLRVGALEDLSAAELLRIEWGARKMCTDLHQFRLHIGPPCLGPGGVRLSVTPWDELVELRNGLRQVTKDVTGLRPWLRELIPFRPRIPIAYATTTLPAAAIRDRLAAVPEHRPILFRVRRLSLLRISRGPGGTAWYTVADMALGKRTGF